MIKALDGHFTSQTVFLIVLVSAPAGSLLIVAAVGIFCICRTHRKHDQEGKSYLNDIKLFSLKVNLLMLPKII